MRHNYRCSFRVHRAPPVLRPEYRQLGYVCHAGRADEVTGIGITMTDVNQMVKESPIACDMSAIEPGRREQHVTSGGELFHAVTEILELPDGYAFRLPGEHDLITRGCSRSCSLTP